MDVNSAAPSAPFTNWLSAAASIQDAVDASLAGDQILVTNGVYQAGGRPAGGGSTTNRLAVDKPITVQSVNGPEVTVIVGQKAAGGGAGAGAIRCAYLTNGVVLSGFTLTNGATASNEDGAGAACAGPDVVITNCIISGNSGSSAGGVLLGTIQNSSIIGNSAVASGGGALQGQLANCIVRGNYAGRYGGGASGGTLSNCTVVLNEASVGGGVYSALVEQCLVYTNAAFGAGGGAYYGTLKNCVISGNRSAYGGGTYLTTLMNCCVFANSAVQYGGGIHQGTISDCTVVGNSAALRGGGVYASTVRNSIVYFNNAPNGSNYYGSTFNYCCTAPNPGGTGNLTADPLLASASELGADSPCINAGTNEYATGVDLDGDPWATPPSMGCNEHPSGSLTSTVVVAIAGSAITVPGVALPFIAQIQGKLSRSTWDFGDGTAATNQPIVQHAWPALGDYTITLTAYNDTYPSGISTSVTVHVSQQVVHYVSQDSINPVPPYTSWATAARRIQDAVDAVFSAPQAAVVVSNGVYHPTPPWVIPANQRPTNQVVIVDKPILLSSVNGPKSTVITGDAFLLCVRLTNNAALSGFTIAKGSNYYDGGGVYCASLSNYVSNCLIISNTTGNTFGIGGGIYGGTVTNCMLAFNFANFGGALSESIASRCLMISNRADRGGAAYHATLNNCLILSNRAMYGGSGLSGGTASNCTIVGNATTGSAYASGGAVDSATIYNSILYYNSSTVYPTNYYSSTLNNCCTTPNFGAGCVTSAPQFVDMVNGDFHLQTNSACINAGLNGAAPGPVDLDGNARIVGGTVDLGAYECQAPALIGFYLWLQTYGLSSSASMASTDSDHDGVSNWNEWLAGTNPTNASSILRVQVAEASASHVILTWSSSTNRRYFVLRSTNGPSSSTFSLLQDNIHGEPEFTSFADTNAPALGSAYYRVGVQP